MIHSAMELFKLQYFLELLNPLHETHTYKMSLLPNIALVEIILSICLNSYQF